MNRNNQTIHEEATMSFANIIHFISRIYIKTAFLLLLIGLEGQQIPSVMAFWFAWQAFYPETVLWQP